MIIQTGFPDPTIFQSVFHLSLPVIEKMLRPAIVYVFLVLALRVFGKRELAQLNPFDLVVLLSLSNTVQNAIIGDDNSVTGGIIGATTLLLVNYLVVRFLFKHRRLDQLVEGKPTTLIRDGKLLTRAMAKELLSKAELEIVAHRQGFDSLTEIAECILEPSGTFVLKGKSPPVSEQRFIEIRARLEEISRQLDELNIERR